MTSLSLDPDRALPFPAEQRSIAREIYGETKDLPLICMHGHVDAEVFAENSPFADPSQLLIVPDHYVFRMLASQGIEPARLGVPRQDGGPYETDSRKIWRTFCENWKLFRGTPSRYWLEHELVEVVGVDLVPSAETADGPRETVGTRTWRPGIWPELPSNPRSTPCTLQRAESQAMRTVRNHRRPGRNSRLCLVSPCHRESSQLDCGDAARQRTHRPLGTSTSAPQKARILLVALL